MKVSEVIGGGVWAASAVMVTRYTWQAMTTEFAQFPEMSGGFGAVTPGQVLKDTGKAAIAAGNAIGKSERNALLHPSSGGVVSNAFKTIERIFMSGGFIP